MNIDAKSSQQNTSKPNLLTCEEDYKQRSVDIDLKNARLV